MKCYKCNALNLDDAKFCRSCGSKLNTGPVTVMDKYPEYHFVPTNLIDWAKPWYARLQTLLFGIVFLAFFFFFCYTISAYFNYYTVSSSYTYNNEDDGEVQEWSATTYDFFYFFHGTNWFRDKSEACAREDSISNYKSVLHVFIPFTLIISLTSLLIVIYGKRKFPSKDNHLNRVADYVEKYHYSGAFEGRKPVLKFFIKDNKMGLLDVAHYCVFLPAKYDRLTWREKNKYLNAIVDNREFVISINGKELK